MDHKLVKVDLADIQLIEGMQNYVKVHLTDKIIVAAYAMKALEELLPASAFLRVHRSFIVPIGTHRNCLKCAYWPELSGYNP